MANHRAAAALILIASLFVAVAVSRADARSTVRPNKTAALRRDTNGQGYMVDAAAPSVLDPECNEEQRHHHHHYHHHHHHHHHDHKAESPESEPKVESPESEPKAKSPEMGLP